MGADRLARRFDEPGVVEERGHAAHHLETAPDPHRPLDAFAQARDRGLDEVAVPGVLGAHRTHQPAGVGDDVVGPAPLDRADREHRRVHRVHLARDHRLELEHQRRRRHDRVAGGMRPRRVAGLAAHVDRELVGRAVGKAGTKVKQPTGSSGWLWKPIAMSTPSRRRRRSSPPPRCPTSPRRAGTSASRCRRIRRADGRGLPPRPAASRCGGRGRRHA